MNFRRSLGRAMLGATILFGLLAVPAGAATAAPAPAPVPVTSVAPATLPSDAYVSEGEDKYVTSEYLTINRWRDSGAQYFDKFDSFIGKQIAEKLQRTTTQSMGMTVGNTLWYITGEFSRTAVTFNILDSAGEAVDKAAGGIGQTVIGSPLLLTMVVGGLGASLLWGAHRGRRGGVKQMLSVLVIVAMISLMSGAAMKSTTDSNGVFQPAAGSPGWIVKNVNAAISFAAEAPATAMLAINEGEVKASASGVGAKYSCAAFTGAMKTRSDEIGADGTIKSVTAVMNNMWQTTGLATWQVSQLGSNNPYAEYAYCRLLESRSDSTRNTHTLTKIAAGEAVGAGTGPLAGTTGPNGAVFKASTNDERGAMMIAWAACRTDNGSDFSVADGWGTKTGGGPWIQAADCQRWWASDGAASDIGVFKIGGSSEAIEKLTDDPRVLNYVKALHGNEVMSGTAAVSVYVLAALLSFIVFALLSIAVIAAKSIMLFFMLMIFILLLGVMFSRDQMGSKLLGLSQKFMGMSVFSFGYTLILAVVAMFTSVLIDFGLTLWGPGNPMSLIWSGMAPVMALALLHFTFTKALKMPSPLTPGGAAAWGAAGGATGAAITRGVAGRMAKNAGQRLGRAGSDKLGAAAKSVLHKATDGRFQKVARGDMTGGARPTGSNDSSGIKNAKATAAAAKAPKTVHEQRVADRAEMREAKAEYFEANPEAKAGTFAGKADRALNNIGGGFKAAGARAAQSWDWATDTTENRQARTEAAGARFHEGLKAVAQATSPKAAGSKISGYFGTRYGITPEQSAALAMSRERSGDGVLNSVRRPVGEGAGMRLAALSTGLKKDAKVALKVGVPAVVGLGVVAGPAGAVIAAGYGVSVARKATKKAVAARQEQRDSWLAAHRDKATAAQATVNKAQKARDSAEAHLATQAAMDAIAAERADAAKAAADANP